MFYFYYFLEIARLATKYAFSNTFSNRFKNRISKSLGIYSIIEANNNKGEFPLRELSFIVGLLFLL